MTPLDQKLDLARGDALIAFGALILQAEIAAGYVKLAADDRLVTVIDDAIERARELQRIKKRMLQMKADNEVMAAAAFEYREQHDDKRGRA